MDRKRLLTAMRAYSKRNPRRKAGKGSGGRFRADGKYGSAVVRG